MHRNNKAVYFTRTLLALVGLGLLGGGYYFGHQSTPPKSETTPRYHVSQLAKDYRYINHSNLPLSQSDNMAFSPKQLKRCHNHAKSAIVFNGQTGKILYQKHPEFTRKVASTAKLMTLYLVQRKAQKIHGWSDNVTIPSNIARMSHDKKDQVGSELKLNAGKQYTVKDLYQSALIESSDSAAIALGQWVAGSNTDFVKMMNAQAHAWHLNGHFNSASGLENDSIAKFGFKVSGGQHDGNKLSARDLVVITQHLLKEFPQITKWSSEPSATVDKAHLINVNRNLQGQVYGAQGCDGLKTGFTPAAGYCLVGTKKQGNSHKIVILLNDPQLFKDGQKLLK